MSVSRQFNLHSLPNTHLNQSSISHFSPKPTNLTSIPKSPNFHLLSSRLTTLNHVITTTNTNALLFDQDNKPQEEESNFWGAVTLIIGTAVGPGMLGLPSATIKAGPLPSTITILLSWLYVISSILLVAELTFVSMEQHGLQEVSFTALATTAFGPRMGTFVALVYACLSFALIVACVSGIGSIVSQWFPFLNSVVSHAFFPSIVWAIIGFSTFTVIDSANRLLCFLMLFSITALVGIGVSVGRENLLTSFTYASWAPSSILPAIPITVLTLGFHVITPFVCKIVGKSAFDARKAILLGGVVPLVMVLSWNLVVLGLAGSSAVSAKNPISLLLSVTSSALPAVQGFAFAALATSLIGYAVSFPKQLIDTLQLISKEFRSLDRKNSPLTVDCFGIVGFATFSSLNVIGTPGQVSFLGSRLNTDSGASKGISSTSSKSDHVILMALVLGAPIIIASFFPATFSKALDFSGVYANCFLFGILPPAMAWIYRWKRKSRSQGSEGAKLLPGGNIVLAILFSVAVTLAIWH